MNIEPLRPVGADVEGFDVGVSDATTVNELRVLLAVHGVLVFRDQDIDDAGFVAFLRQFGELAFTAGETPVDGCPDLNVVSNVGRRTTPRSVFHTDTSYVRSPPAYTALRVVQTPRVGGETLFTNQYLAAETLDQELRDRLCGKMIRHVVSGVDPGVGEETSAEHAVFRDHPVSHRTALFISTPDRCVSLSGVGDREGAELISLLYEHSTQPRNVMRHRWSPGDVVMWDNRCVLHKADHSDVTGERVMHRGMVHGAWERSGA